ncbi:hypothetical protein BH11PSE11_BH11PSE11_22680 [soil metagenome]
MSLRIKLTWIVLASAIFFGLCEPAAARELRSSSTGVDVIYEVQSIADFRSFLAMQAPGSVSAIGIFEPPSRVAVVARIKITLPAHQIGTSFQFSTAFQLASGVTVPQNWRIDNVPPGKLEFKAIFGLPNDVLNASTVIVAR